MVLSYQLLALLLEIEAREWHIMDMLVKERKHNYHTLYMELIISAPSLIKKITIISSKSPPLALLEPLMSVQLLLFG